MDYMTKMSSRYRQLLVLLVALTLVLGFVVRTATAFAGIGSILSADLMALAASASK
jgi:hypothetical protein